MRNVEERNLSSKILEREVFLMTKDFFSLLKENPNLIEKGLAIEKFKQAMLHRLYQLDQLFIGREYHDYFFPYENFSYFLDVTKNLEDYGYGNFPIKNQEVFCSLLWKNFDSSIEKQLVFTFENGKILSFLDFSYSKYLEKENTVFYFRPKEKQLVNIGGMDHENRRF